MRTREHERSGGRCCSSPAGDVLLHVTVGLGVIGASYVALERIARRSPLLAWSLAGLVVVAALVTFAVVSLG